MSNSKAEPREIIGLVPAAGQANRLGRLPCSKEIYPVGFGEAESGQPGLPKVVGQYLLEKMRAAGAKKAYVILRSGKWDIPAYFGDGSHLDMQLAYLMMGLPYGVPYTLDQAYPFTDGATIVFGFPDLLFEPEDAFVHLLRKQAASEADIVLGLFPSDRPHKMDMVEQDASGRVTSIAIKPGPTELALTWLIAAWAPAFSRFMHEYVGDRVAPVGDGRAVGRELHMSEVVQAAIEEKMRVEAVTFTGSRCVDIGTSEDLIAAVRESLGLGHHDRVSV